jgi:hypothetical protein
MNIICCVFLLLVPCDSFVKRILKSGILSFAPFFKAHHILVLEPEKKTEGIYLIDISPLDQSKPQTLLNLALGKWVPAELRLRNIRGEINDETILDKWYEINRELSPEDSLQITKSVLAKMKDEKIKRFYKYIESSWKKEMNLYTNNCQHFTDIYL